MTRIRSRRNAGVITVLADLIASVCLAVRMRSDSMLRRSGVTSGRSSTVGETSPEDRKTSIRSAIAGSDSTTASAITFRTSLFLM